MKKNEEKRVRTITIAKKLSAIDSFCKMQKENVKIIVCTITINYEFKFGVKRKNKNMS